MKEITDLSDQITLGQNDIQTDRYLYSTQTQEKQKQTVLIFVYFPVNGIHGLFIYYYVMDLAGMIYNVTVIEHWHY